MPSLLVCMVALSSLLHKRYAVVSMFGLDADENWFPLHFINTSSFLSTVTPSFLKIEIAPSLADLTTLINEVGKWLKVSACLALGERLLNGRQVTWVALLVPPFATPTLLVDLHRMGRPSYWQLDWLT